MSVTFHPSKYLKEDINYRYDNDYEINSLIGGKKKLCKKNNGFMIGVLDAYCYHKKLVIKPDHVWYTIMCQFSRYINLNKELFRNKIVSFEGKETINVNVDTNKVKNIEIGSLLRAIKKEVKIEDKKLIDSLQTKFSTTDTDDEIVFDIIFLSTIKEYYNYDVTMSCGLPEVTMLGTVEDWKLLKEKTKIILDYDNQNNYMKKWWDLLEPVLDNFIKSSSGNPDLEWWCKCCTFKCNGSGFDYLSGWLSVFGIFTNYNRWNGDNFTINRGRDKFEWPIINMCDIGMLDLCINLDISGEKYILASNCGYFLNRKNSIEPKLYWFLEKKEEKRKEKSLNLEEEDEETFSTLEKIQKRKRKNFFIIGKSGRCYIFLVYSDKLKPDPILSEILDKMNEKLITKHKDSVDRECERKDVKQYLSSFLYVKLSVD